MKTCLVVLLMTLVTLSSCAFQAQAETTPDAKSPTAASLPTDWKTCLEQGGVLKLSGMYNQAEPYLRKAVELAESQFGQTDPRWYISLNLLAGNCRYQGKLAEAERLYNQEIESAKKNNMPGQLVATMLDNLSAVYTETQRPGEAMKAKEEALELYKKTVGENNFDYAMALGGYGFFRAKNGKMEEGLKDLERAVELLKTLPSPNPIALATNADNLAHLYSDTGQFDKAMKNHELALSIYEKVLPPGHPDWIICMQNTAATAFQKKDFAESMRLMEKALPVVEKTRGANSVEAQELKRRMEAVGAHIPGWKPTAPKANEAAAKPRADQALDVFVNLDKAYPNVNPTQIGQITGQPLIKGQMQGFWFTEIRTDTVFNSISARFPPGKDIPILITLSLQNDVPLTTEAVLKQFGTPVSNANAKPGEPTKGIRYNRDWGFMAFAPDSATGRITAALFSYGKQPEN